MMMTPLEFYSSITPDCSRQVGAGAGKHVEINEKDIKANQVEKICIKLSKCNCFFCSIFCKTVVIINKKCSSKLNCFAILKDLVDCGK